MTIPVDQVITIDVLSLHFDPNYWGPVDPNEFYPLRFKDSSKINQCAYMPFGFGPRICIGNKYFISIFIKISI